jgi:hydroxymethylbilane synthase
MAGFSRLNGERLDLEGMVAELDGSKIIRDKITGERNEAEDMGIRLARSLLASGADEILERIYGKA